MKQCNSQPEPCMFFMPANAHRDNACGKRLRKGILPDTEGCNNHHLHASKDNTGKQFDSGRKAHQAVDVDRLIALAGEGKLIKEIAEIMDIHPCTVSGYNRKLKLGIERPGKFKIDLDIMRQMAAAGKYRADMVKAFGCDRSNISATAKRHNIQIQFQPRGYVA